MFTTLGFGSKFARTRISRPPGERTQRQEHAYRRYTELILIGIGFLILGPALAGCTGEKSQEQVSLAGSPPAEPPRTFTFVETPAGRRVTPKRRPPDWGDAADSPYWIAQLEAAPTPELRAALARAKFREVAYLPYRALLLERAPGVRPPSLQGIVGWEAYRAQDRVSREFSKEAVERHRTPTPVPILVHGMAGRSLARVTLQLLRHGVKTSGVGQVATSERLGATLPAEDAREIIGELAELPEVFFIERVHRAGLQMDRSVGSVQSGRQGFGWDVTPIWRHGLYGEGQVLSLIDTGLAVDSCYFTNGGLPALNSWSQATGLGTAVDATHRKILAYNYLFSCDQYPDQPDCEKPGAADSFDFNMHGTWCAGILSGDRDRAPEVHATQDGLAPGAKLVVQDASYFPDPCADLPGLGCPVVDLYPLYAQAYAQGSRIHSNSWGDREEAPQASNYTARAQDEDRFMWEHRDFLIVHSAGNKGEENLDFSVNSPSTNKNGLSVGATRPGDRLEDDESLGSYSSRGWSADGRIKPDIVAPGCVTAAMTNFTGTQLCEVIDLCGTSGAAPTVAAAAALVRQYFTEGYYPSGNKTEKDAFVPSGALLKALLVNSAVGLTGTDNMGETLSPIPSNEQGWGRVQLDRALSFPDSPHQLFVYDGRTALAAGSTSEFYFALSAVEARADLKITLAWTDYPAAPDSPPENPTLDDPSTLNAPRLVNDLDLKIEGPSGSFLGNVFQNGSSVGGGSPDRRNNLEQVRLPSPIPGDYRLQVKAAQIIEGGQDFVLVITGRWQKVQACSDARCGTGPGDAGVDSGGAGGSTGGDAGTRGGQAGEGKSPGTSGDRLRLPGTSDFATFSGLDGCGVYLRAALPTPSTPG